MSTLDKARTVVGQVIDAGRERGDALRRRRRRGRLMRDLGELCYRQRKGATATGSEIDRVVHLVDELDPDPGEDDAMTIDLTVTETPTRTQRQAETRSRTSASRHTW